MLLLDYASVSSVKTCKYCGFGYKMHATKLSWYPVRFRVVREQISAKLKNVYISCRELASGLQTLSVSKANPPAAPTAAHGTRSSPFLCLVQTAPVPIRYERCKKGGRYSIRTRSSASKNVPGTT